MKDLVLILMVALLATCVAVPRGGETLPQLDSLASPTLAAPRPLGWIAGRLWGAIYALEGI